MQADFPVLLDACVLANAGVCDLYLRLAESPRLFVPRWSEVILEEVRKTQTTKFKKPYSTELAAYWNEQIKLAFPEASISGFDQLIPQMTNDEKDRHVLAAAIKGNVSLIITFNLKHFPAASLQSWNIEAVHPEDYLSTLYCINPAVVVAKLNSIAKTHKEELQDVLFHLGKSVPRFVAQVLGDMGEELA